MLLPPIYFYLPASYWPASLPSDMKDKWSGFGVGMYTWTVQTYLHLQGIGFPCQLVKNLPAKGIVVVHHNALRAHPELIKPGPELLLVCIKAEGRGYPYAQLHLVQNPTEADYTKGWYYLPHWPQPGLISRDAGRGDRFENITFFGHQDSLAPELITATWGQKLQELGLQWCPQVSKHHWQDYRHQEVNWHDYSQVDAIVAVRSFNPSYTFANKPATKLYNAWLASVPAILGVESAYQEEGIPGEDYLEVTSLNNLIRTLKHLQQNPQLRQELVKNGQKRVQEILPQETLKKWRNFLANIAIPAWENWCSQSRRQQQLQLQQSYFLFNLRKAQDKSKQLLTKIKG